MSSYSSARQTFWNTSKPKPINSKHNFVMDKINQMIATCFDEIYSKRIRVECLSIFLNGTLGINDSCLETVTFSLGGSTPWHFHLEWEDKTYSLTPPTSAVWIYFSDLRRLKEFLRFFHSCNFKIKKNKIFSASSDQTSDSKLSILLFILFRP